MGFRIELIKNIYISTIKCLSVLCKLEIRIPKFVFNGRSHNLNLLASGGGRGWEGHLILIKIIDQCSSQAKHAPTFRDSYFIFIRNFSIQIFQRLFETPRNFNCDPAMQKRTYYFKFCFQFIFNKHFMYLFCDSFQLFYFYFK